VDLKTKILKQFGLSENETLVYLESLKKDDLSPYQISKLTGIPRTTVYDVLMSLSLKGLVELDQSDGFTKQQTKVKAKNPSVLRKILQQKRKDLVGLETDIAHIMPELKGFFHKSDSNADFKFYPGIEGAREVTLRNEEYDIALPEVSWDYLIPLDIFGSANLNKSVSIGNSKRLREGISDKILIPFNDWTRHVLSYQYQRDNNYLENREFRYIDASFFEIFNTVIIQGEFIKITSVEEDEAWGLVIKSKSLSKTFMSLFELTWSVATPVTKEKIKSWGENEFLAKQKEKGYIE
jgi:predicted transcriptional regulator